MLLENKVAIVTGAASGLGKDIAQRYAREGAKVAVADLNLDAATQVVAEINQAGGNALALEMDVTSETGVNQGIASVLAHYGQIDILVSNAGIQIVKRLEEFSYDEWKKMLAIHLDGAFLTTRACLKAMYERGAGGSIIYMGSVHSKIASRFKAPYVAAKHGLLGLCRTIAIEGAEYGVRANVICPGFVRTPLVEKQIPEQAEKLGMTEEEVVQKIMLNCTVDGEFTELADISDIAVLFASHKTNALTGQSLVVSHGWYVE